MSANGISHRATRQLRQEGKLAIAEAKRQGKTVARDGTITGSLDSTKPYYRENNVLDIDLLSAKYVGNTAVDDGAPLEPHRPWTPQP
jgi:hypothetical protein